jgi:hypothetical protein
MKKLSCLLALLRALFLPLGATAGAPPMRSQAPASIKVGD